MTISEEKKSSRSKNTSPLPQELQQFIQFFTVVDQFHCFLVKNRLICTLGKLQSMMRGCFDLNKLLILQKICPQVFEITLVPPAVTGSVNVGKNNDDDSYSSCEVVFLVEGTSKVISLRFDQFLHSQTNVSFIFIICNDYVVIVLSGSGE